MLRSLDLLRQITPAASLIADDDGHMTLAGGGSGYTKPWHWHDGLMLLLPSLGAFRLKHEARREGVWVSEDRFAVVPASHAHDTSTLRDNQAHIVAYVKENALRRIEASLGSLSRVRTSIRTSGMFPVTPEIRTLRALCLDGTGDTLGSAAVRAHLSAALLIRCLAAIEQGRPLPSASRHGHGKALIRQARAIIAARLDQDVPLDLLAERLDVSRRHLTRLFHAEVGLSVGAFHRAKRLDAAKDMLRATDLPVDEIASRVGFESGSALSRALRRRDGQAATGIRASSRALVAHSVKK
ncbi:helix-turn-helix domain-containing protein [Methylobacterium sp. J-048]|uniref:AraC family transcriptional regulator n=1 Tax=unclassified Methylobacterium TaxID=2615210 RepID=UPI001FBAAEB3|nr:MULTISPECIES: helix-turn-helix domain-containing protein [unclassified Methylobacterium]MCJ2060170.1 helix-turn-helix domain-containing protein [Methylobacterium sp. J-048]MCJ2122378.1 helix-turn-helix domain-containing protein [Methylobacterium sp. J-077]